MTRKEADKLLRNCSLDVDGYYWTDVEDVLMKLSDDFESRTCESCKHSGLYTMGWMPCLHPENEYHIKEVHDDFGCNKWEAKDAK